MPSDASIYSLIQQPKPMAGPMEMMGQSLQIRHLMDQSQLAQLQRGELERGIDEGRRLRELFAGGGNITPQAVMAINPEKGMAYGKAIKEQEKADADLAKTKAETLIKNAEYMRNRLAGVNDQASYNVWLEEGARLFGPDAARANPPQFSPEVKQRLMMKAEDALERLKPLYEVVNLGGSSRVIQKNPNAPGATTGDLPHTPTPGEMLNATRPIWDTDRGVFITPPAPRMATPPFAGAQSAPAPAAAQSAQTVPPRSAPGVTPVPGIDAKPKLTPGQEAFDREFAKELVAFRSGGNADQAKQIAQLKDVSAALSDPQANLTGFWVGNRPDWANSIVNPQAQAMKERVEEVVQRSLRAILGAQFTEKEGERLIARAYNPRLSEKENAVRVNRLITQLEAAFQSKADAAAYFEKNGTLAGWKGKMPSISDFNPEPARAAPKDASKAGPAKAGGIKFLGFE